MSLSTSIASSRGGGPRKHTGSISAPNLKSHGSSASTGSGNRKQQSSNSEEEIAQRHHRSRQNSSSDTSCCVISLLCITSLPVWATTLLVSTTVVCLSLLQDMVDT